MEQCFADTRQWVRAVQLLEDMKTAGSQPDAVCYNGAIHACAKVTTCAGRLNVVHHCNAGSANSTATNRLADQRAYSVSVALAVAASTTSAPTAVEHSEVYQASC
eukprot:876-Heterococcus_DN1.PRE.3